MAEFVCLGDTYVNVDLIRTVEVDDDGTLTVDYGKATKSLGGDAGADLLDWLGRVSKKSAPFPKKAAGKKK
jgi:hypothetical protein